MYVTKKYAMFKIPDKIPPKFPMAATKAIAIARFVCPPVLLEFHAADKGINGNAPQQAIVAATYFAAAPWSRRVINNIYPIIPINATKA